MAFKKSTGSRGLPEHKVVEEPKFFYVSGYWKDDGKTFDGYIVKSTHDIASDEEDNTIFFYGFDESLLKDVIEKGVDTSYEFVLTSYTPMIDTE